MNNVKKLLLVGVTIAALCLSASAIIVKSKSDNAPPADTQIVSTASLGTCFKLSICRGAMDGQFTQQACWDEPGISWKSDEGNTCFSNPNIE